MNHFDRYKGLIMKRNWILLMAGAILIGSLSVGCAPIGPGDGNVVVGGGVYPPPILNPPPFGPGPVIFRPGAPHGPGFMPGNPGRPNRPPSFIPGGGNNRPSFPNRVPGTGVVPGGIPE